MKVLVNEMPHKEKACMFYREEKYAKDIYKIYCILNGKSCSLKKEAGFTKCNCLMKKYD